MVRCIKTIAVWINVPIKHIPLCDIVVRRMKQ